MLATLLLLTTNGNGATVEVQWLPPPRPVVSTVGDFNLSVRHPHTEWAPHPRLVGQSCELTTETGTLHATLDLPAQPAPWPVLVLHPGSGPTDRNGNGPLLATDAYKQLGRALATKGFAVLRIDKRGIAASAKAGPKEDQLTIETYAADAVAWTQYLRADPRFTTVGFIGHSEGWLVGLIAANEARWQVMISLCGPGRPLQTILREQLKNNLPEKLYSQADAILKELEAGRRVDDTPQELAALFRPSVQPFLISLFRYNCAQWVAKMQMPVLIISGSTDLQVAKEDALALAKANPRAQAITIEEMNHVLKRVKGPSRWEQLPSYTDASLPLHPQLVPEIAKFLTEHLQRKN